MKIIKNVVKIISNLTSFYFKLALIRIKTFLIIPIVLHSSFAIELNCNFVVYSTDGYNCKVENLITGYNEREVTKIIGYHLPGKKNWNVETLFIPSADGLTFLPTSVSKHFVNLKKFEVSNGSLKYIAQSDFSGLISLQTIFITKTLLTSIPEDTFDNLPRLETLILSDNKIRVLKLKTFAKLSSLKKLSLSENSLEILESKMFEGNLRIEEIDLSNNKLRVIESELFNSLKYVTKVLLEGNFCTTKSFPKGVTMNELKAELSNKCTNDTEIVKSSKLTEMNHEVLVLQQSVNTSQEKIKRLDENLVKLSLQIDEIQSEKRELINDVEDVQGNLTVADEKNKDLEFRLTVAYKTITSLKDDFDSFKEKCEQNYSKIINEKMEHEFTRLNGTAETFESAESSKVFIKTSHISSSSVFILLIVIVIALAGNVLLIIVIVKMKKRTNVPKTDETEMGNKNAHDKQ